MKNAYRTTLMACVALAFTTTLQAAEDNETPEEALSVSVIVLSKVAIPVERDVEAKLISPNDTPVSPELAAKVLKIEADVGDEVQEGDVLARLDCRDYDVKLRQAAAGVSTVKARIKATAARVGAAESRVGAAGSRVSAAGSRVGATGSQVNAAASRVHAAVSRVKAAEAGIQAATARMQSTGTGINTAKSRVNTAKAQANAARARIPSAQAQFKLAQSELNRNRQLRNKKLIPVNVLDQAQATFNSAQSNLSAAQADYAAAQAAVSTANEEINAAAANLQAGKADVASSRANVETVKAELGSSKADLGTAKANMGTTKADMETAKAEVETARADLEGAKADLLIVETELENALAQQEAAEVVTGRCLVKAPFDGQITQRQFQLGQISSPGMAAFQLLQHQGLEVIAQLSPDEVRDQEQGEKVRFVSDDVELEVERRAVVAQVASDSGTQEVRYRVNSAHDLPVGKTGRVRWQGKLPAIPPDWLLRREGGLGLMLAVDGKAEFYPLKNAREGQATLIDLPDNTLLIDANRLRARNGQKIQQAGE